MTPHLRRGERRCCLDLFFSKEFVGLKFIKVDKIGWENHGKTLRLPSPNAIVRNSRPRFRDEKNYEVGPGKPVISRVKYLHLKRLLPQVTLL